MKVIKKIKTKPTVLIRFRTNVSKFNSNYERNQFFRGLHGWKQIIIKKTQKTEGPHGVRVIEQRYVYPRSGLLNEIEHVKVADSAFIVAMEDMKRMTDFFKNWEEKVNAEFMQIFMPEKQWNSLTEKVKGDINVQ
ncbi:hypothetical protein CL614_03875 [archaeon]|nr:hypothetical protein [archaeon]